MSAAKLLTVADLAERWRMSPGGIHRLARDGQIPTVALGKHRRFRLEDIEAFEAAGGTAPRVTA